nr:hypothetical protein [Tanacetum cinerariifolium]
LLLTWDKVSEIKDAFGNKQYNSEDIQELFRKLFNDVKNIHEVLAEYINTPSWNRLAFYNNDEDDDEDYTIAITPDFLITDSLNSLIISSPKIDSLLEEFSGELTHINLIPQGINEADFDPEEEIRLVEKLLIVTLLWRRSIYSYPDDSMPLGIKNDDYDSEGDILFLEELLSNDSPSLPDNKSFYFDVPSYPRPRAKLPNVGIKFDSNTGLLTTKVVGDISEHYVYVPNVLPTQPTLGPGINTLLSFSFENEDK